MFDPNSTFLFILAGLVILFVIAQSVFFLVRAYRRGRALGMDMKQIRKTILSTAVFTFAPAVSILLGVITLSKFLGLPLPWLRLSVIGAITYELPAATTTANALGITALSETITDPQVYTAIAWVMTLGIFPGLIWVPLFIKKIQGVIVLCITVPMGIVAMCYGGVVSSLLCLIYNAYYTQKLIGYGYVAQMKDLFHILAHALVMGIGVWCIVQTCDSLWLQLSVGVVAGMVYYIAGAYLMRFEELQELLALLHKNKW